jgi:hypothetical protein
MPLLSQVGPPQGTASDELISGSLSKCHSFAFSASHFYSKERGFLTMGNTLESDYKNQVPHRSKIMIGTAEVAAECGK